MGGATVLIIAETPHPVGHQKHISKKMSIQPSGQQGGSIWDLSLYEIHRKPHEVITDTSVIGVSPRSLHSELMCPICLDLMKNAQTTKECLHRFCQECIITALRSGNKECPTCRKKLVSKRSLRSDPNFDALIAKIYPDRDELLQHQEKHRPYRPPLHTLSIQQRKRRDETPQDALADGESPTPETKVPKLEPVDTEELEQEELTNSREEEEETRFEFQLRPLPSDETVSCLDIRNLATSPDATVAHLVKFLSLIQEPSNAQEPSKMQMSPDSYIISAPFGNDDGTSCVPLSRTASLKQICDSYWTPGEKMKLYFSTKPRGTQ